MWEVLPEGVKEAYEGAKSRDEKTEIINSSIDRCGQKLQVNMSYSQRLLRKKTNSVGQQKSGANLSATSCQHAGASCLVVSWSLWQWPCLLAAPCGAAFSALVCSLCS